MLPAVDTLRSRDGLDLSIARWPGDGAPGILFVHATGFVKEVWAPVVGEIRAAGVDGPCVAMDQRGHGDSDTPEPPFHWAELGSDVVSLRSELDGTWVGVGHSSGAAAIAMAEIDAPGAFEALLLIEPIVLPPPHERVEDHELVRMTLRRRFAFGDREAAIANFSQKQPFASWDPRVLDAYVDGGLRSDGNRLLLKCNPTVEAEFYRMGSQHDTWDRLGAIDVPVALLAGGASNTHSAEFMALLAERFREVTVTVVDGATHFVPMEQPQVVAAQVIGLLGRM